ncbi:NACHT domain-containing protein [Micromonospora parva]|uniref:globin domain-containing protein n=1 Tax=Micromonospora parva TaxID=1464048 RepID=UPI0037B45DC1
MPAIERVSTNDSGKKIIASLAELSQSVRRTVLLGAPGSGKTALCHALINHYARQPDGPVPFFVSVRDFARTFPPSTSVARFVDHMTEAIYQCPFPKGLVEKLLETGHALVVFDGLDELDSPQNAAATANVIELFASEFPDAGIVVTSRESGYGRFALDATKFEVFRVCPFDDGRIREFVSKLTRSGLDGRGAELVERVSRQHHLRALAERPLTLALLFAAGGDHAPRIPYGNVAQLLTSLIDGALKWDELRGIGSRYFSVSTMRSVLQSTAHQLLLQERDAISEPELLRLTASLLREREMFEAKEARDAAIALVRSAIGRVGLLVEAGVNLDGDRCYSFSHRSFLEYFAAAHIARNRSIGDIVNLCVEHLSDPLWQPILRLVTELVDDNYHEGAERLIEGLIKASKGTSGPAEYVRWAAKRSFSRRINTILAAEDERAASSDTLEGTTVTVAEKTIPVSHYERIGGAGPVKAAVELFYDKVLADPELAGYFADADMVGQRRHLALMLTVVLGGPNEYTGRSLAEAHQPLNIPVVHYARVGQHLTTTLTELGVPADVVADVQTVLDNVQDQVVDSGTCPGA